MKRINNLYADIISLDNLRLADEKARKGKKRKRAIRRFDKNREGNLLALHISLANKTFHTSEYHTFKIYDPKERDIYCLPYYPDRILQHALLNVLEPIWGKTLTHNTYSSLKNRGISGCAKAVEKGIRSFDIDKPLYCLKIDIRKFYPSIKHEVLKEVVRRKIKDKDVLWLLDDIIDSADGLPIGNYVSQYLANLSLSYFMHYVNESLPYSIQKDLGLEAKPVIKAYEYADDIVFLADNKPVLHRTLELVREYLKDHLQLEVKGNYQVYPVPVNKRAGHGRGIDYVGFVFYREQKLLRKSIKKKLCRRIAKLNKLNLSLKEYTIRIGSYLGWCMHSNSKHLLQTIIKPQDYGTLLSHK